MCAWKQADLLDRVLSLPELSLQILLLHRHLGSESLELPLT